MEYSSMENATDIYKSYLIFGASKTGKTMLASTLPSSEVLFVNTENNIDSLSGSKIIKANCFSEKDFLEVINDIQSGKMPKLKWLFIDSITDLVQKIYNEVFKRVKDGRQAYGEFELKYNDLMDKLKSLPCNVVCIAQQGYIKDEITGGMIFGATLTWAKLQQGLPYKFSAVLATRTIKDEKGNDIYVIQCLPCPQYAVGVRTKFGEPNPLQGFEAPNLMAIHNKILGLKN